MADILKNAKLKSARELFGSPGDQRYTLVNSATWTWPKKFKADVPGYEQVLSKRVGNRLLGIRVEKLLEAENDKPAAVTLTLVNAGGNANGPALGGYTIRYQWRSMNEKTVFELVEDLGP